MKNLCSVHYREYWGICSECVADFSMRRDVRNWIALALVVGMLVIIFAPGSNVWNSNLWPW